MPHVHDAVQVLMGGYGKYQLRLTFIVFMVKFSSAFNQLAIIFLAPMTSHSCDGEKAKCPCPNPVYDTSEFPRTIIMEWNLICERKWLVSFTQCVFQSGTLFGCIFSGIASDRFGRKKPILGAVLLQLIAGAMAPFTKNYWIFTFLRFLIGFAVGGLQVTTFVLMMEFTGAQYRYIISALYHVPFNMGHMMLPGIAYFFRDYKDFQLAILVASAILLPYFCLLPDSPLWCLTANKVEDAVKIITRVATVNKLPTEQIRSEIEAYLAGLQGHHLKQSTIFDMFRNSSVRKVVFCTAFLWFVCGYCFYGVSQYTGQLSGNIYINVLASAALSGIGSLLAIPLMRVMGRRTLMTSQNLIAAICLLVLAISSNTLFSSILAAVATMATFITYVVIYLYCGEVFPTVVRNAAIGISSMTARIGSMVAPFVIDTGDVRTWLPPVLFGIFPLFATIVVLFVPETKGVRMLNTLEQAAEFQRTSPGFFRSRGSKSSPEISSLPSN